MGGVPFNVRHAWKSRTRTVGSVTLGQAVGQRSARRKAVARQTAVTIPQDVGSSICATGVQCLCGLLAASRRHEPTPHPLSSIRRPTPDMSSNAVDPTEVDANQAPLVPAVFADRDTAARAVEELLRAGIDRADIGVVV